MVDFGFATMAFILNVTFLEAPCDEGGYGMSKMAVASCIPWAFLFFHATR